MKQQIVKKNYKWIKKILEKEKVKKIFLVSETFLEHIEIKQYINSLGVDYIDFKDFTPNPKYEDITKGLEIFKKEKCDFILALGGGSSIDTAKCIKLFAVQKTNDNYIDIEYVKSEIKLLAVPTTAGTGSEATKFAVCYYEGEKKSILDESMIPEYVVIDASVIKTLPKYQKDATLLDALCQSIEAYWSVNSNKASKKYAKKSIKLILKNLKQYKKRNKKACLKMMIAANLSGKAINISQTTAAHAMSYKITSLYGIAHGHAVAIMFPHVWEYMINNTDKCTDKRGVKYLQKTFKKLNGIFKTKNSEDSIKKFNKILNSFYFLEFDVNKEKLIELTNSVNSERLKNNPVFLDEKALENIYEKALMQSNEKNKNVITKKQLQKIQKHSLEVLLVVKQFCKKHNINYYLGEGTLLGAIRHSGFIPWDDDIDILMLRNDYEKFQKLAKENFVKGYQLETKETIENYPVIQAKVRKTEDVGIYQKKVEKLLGNGGPYIDIFPLDNVPQKCSLKQIKRGRKIHRWRRVLFYKTTYSRNFKKNKWYILFLVSKLISYKNIRKRIYMLMTEMNNIDNNYLVNWSSYYKCYKETFSRDAFDEIVYKSFEGHEFPVPNKYDYVLTTTYGDYMKLPPKRKRVCKHNFNII